MQLKEEFRTYEALRREHDSQIVQIAMEGGLRIAPDQWSSLLYGDQSHKSHMQSIIDKVCNGKKRILYILLFNCIQLNFTDVGLQRMNILHCIRIFLMCFYFLIWIYSLYFPHSCRLQHLLLKVFKSWLLHCRGLETQPTSTGCGPT